MKYFIIIIIITLLSCESMVEKTEGRTITDDDLVAEYELFIDNVICNYWSKKLNYLLDEQLCYKNDSLHMYKNNWLNEFYDLNNSVDKDWVIKQTRLMKSVSPNWSSLLGCSFLGYYNSNMTLKNNKGNIVSSNNFEVADSVVINGVEAFEINKGDSRNYYKVSFPYFNKSIDTAFIMIIHNRGAFLSPEVNYFFYEKINNKWVESDRHGEEF